MRLATDAADVGQVAAVRCARRSLVEVDGEPQGPDPLPRLLGQPRGVFEGRPCERHEGQHVERAHPRMLPDLRGQVYLGGAGLCQRDGCLEDGFLLAGERQDAPIVVRVGVKVEDADALHSADGGDDARDLRPVASLAEIGDGLEEGRAHATRRRGRGRGGRRH